MPVQTQSRLGQTVSHGGHTYQLEAVSGGAHRWVRVDKDQATAQPGAAPGQPAQAGAVMGSGDHAARHAFTQKQLGSIQGPARGIMAAMHSHPDAASGGRVVSKDFAPEQAQQLHGWLTQNVGKQAGGGQVVDLGKGRLGFASPAGSILLTRGSAGTMEIKFSNQTGVVAEAMGGREASPKAAAAAPAGSAQAGDKPPPAPPPVIAEPPTKQLSPEAAQAVGGIMDKPQAPAQPPAPSTPRAAADEAKKHLENTTRQWQQELASGLTPKGNARWRSYAAAARSIWQQHETLARDWERKSKAGAKQAGAAGAGGAAPHGDKELAGMEERIHQYDPNAIKQIKGMTQRPEAYRDMVQQYHDALYPDEKRQDKGGNELLDFERRNPELNPPKHEDRPDEIEWENESLPDDAGGTSQAERNPPITSDPRLEQWRHAGDAFKKAKERREVPAAAVPPEREQSAMARLGIDPQTGKTSGPSQSEPSPVPPFISQWPASPESRREAQQLKPPKHKIEQRLREEARKGFGVQAPEQPKKEPKRHQKLKGMIGGSVSPESQKLLHGAIEAGHIQRPSQLRSVLRAAGKIHARSNPSGDTGAPDHPAHAEAVRRLRNRQGREAWQAITKKQAEAWDMKPEEYDSLARELHGEFVKHHGEREKAKQHARQVTGLTAADINRAENQGLDSATAKRFDEIGRDLASSYPGVFGGEGYGDEAKVDYGAKLWDLVREGAKRTPGRTSADFINHIDEFLRSQVKGSSGTQGGSAAEGDDASAVPFWRRSDPGATVEKYREFLAERVNAAAAETAKPSDAQAKAGNYRKGKVTIRGLTISIENPKGTKRKEDWPPLSCHYGYVNRVEGKDGDQLDVFIGPDPESEIVFVIDQVTEGGHFDEHKCMLGFSNERAAKEAYLANYPKGWRCGRITPITFDQFRDWACEGDTTKRIAGQV